MFHELLLLLLLKRLSPLPDRVIVETVTTNKSLEDMKGMIPAALTPVLSHLSRVHVATAIAST